MGIYIIPSDFDIDACDWIIQHQHIRMSNQEIVEMYHDYRSLNMVPVALQFSWMGYLGAVACSLEEVQHWIKNCDEDGRGLDWFLISIDDLEDDACISPELIKDMLNGT